MERFLTKPEWLEIVQSQETLLVYPSFSRENAMRLGCRIAQLAEQRYHGAVAIAILEDDMPVFSYKMPGTGLENEWWMRRKLNASRAAGCSSLLACLKTACGQLGEDWIEEKAETRVACGGCFPLRLQSEELWGYILVSGLEHYEDHQVIADALSEDLGVEAPKVQV